MRTIPESNTDDRRMRVLDESRPLRWKIPDNSGKWRMGGVCNIRESNTDDRGMRVLDEP